MDIEERRLQCLKMAFELGGNTDAVLSAAQRMLDFINGTDVRSAAEAASVAAAEAKAEAVAAAIEPPPPAETPVEQVPAVATLVGSPEVEQAAAEPVIADPISACGTALVMPEGGNLADAQPSPEMVAAAAAPAERESEAAEAAPAAEAQPAEAPAQAEATEAAPPQIEAAEAAPAAEAQPAEAPAQAEATEAVEQAPAEEEVVIVPAADTPAPGAEAAPPA
jgi:hypothetical protein